MFDFLISFVSFLIFVGLFLSWAGLILYRRIKLKKRAPVRNYAWGSEIFRPAVHVIRQKPQMFIFLILLNTAAFFYSLPSYYMLRANDAQVWACSITWKDRPGRIISLLFTIPASFTHCFGHLYTAMVPSGTMLVGATCLFAGAFLFLRPEPEPWLDVRHSKLIKFGLGMCAGLGAILLLKAWFSDVIARLESRDEPTWNMIVADMFSGYVQAYAQAVVLLVLKFLVEGKDISFLQAVMTAKKYSKAFFIFALSIAGIEIVTAPSLLAIINSFQKGLWLSLFSSVLMESHNLLIGVLSFVPVFIVLRDESLVSGFWHSVDLWAGDFRSTAIFAGIGGSILFVPWFARDHWRYFFHASGWGERLFAFGSSCFISIAGLIVITSMIVFCKKSESIRST